MEENKEIRTVLTEVSFTQMCKMGFIRHTEPPTGKLDIVITSSDIRELIGGKILTKRLDDVTYKYALQDIGTEMIREILLRSPVYSGLAYEM